MAELTLTASMPTPLLVRQPAARAAAGQPAATGVKAPGDRLVLSGPVQGQLRVQGERSAARIDALVTPAGDVAVRGAGAAVGPRGQVAVGARVAVDVPAGGPARVDVRVAAEGRRAAGGVTVQVDPKLNAKQEGIDIRGELSVGPDVLARVRDLAYQQTRQAIRNRQQPQLEVPAIAKQALATMAKANVDHALDRHLAVNLSNPALVEAVRQGVTRGIEDQPFRNRGLIRPEGMWRLRGAIANSRPVQAKIVTTASGGIQQLQRQVERLSNGVVVFQQVPQPARTGAAVTMTGPGFQARVQGSVRDVGSFMPGR